MSIAVLLAALLVAMQSCSARAQDIPFGFFAGDYLLVGKAPDGGTAYSGTARLGERDGRLILERRVGAESTRASGRFETPQPPGEGRVLRFREAPGPWVTTCLVTIDLNNYPRLTCYRLDPARAHSAPGLETYFPTSSWPEGTPGKAFAPPG